jgi:Protein of unknown function (DUF4089)
MATKRAKSLSKRKPKTSRAKTSRVKASRAQTSRATATRKAPAKTAAKATGKAAVKTAGKRKALGGDPLDALVDASARALGLPLEPAWRPAVRSNLDATLRLAALFMDFPLPDDAEPAPVFAA